MIQDRDLGDENDARPTPHDWRFTCERCGKPVMFVWVGRPDNAYVMHTGCEKPQVTLTCDNPRRLGVVMGITE